MVGGGGTYNGVQVCRFSVEGYVNVVSANIEILVVEWLVDVADELRMKLETKTSMPSFCFQDHEGITNV